MKSSYLTYVIAFLIGLPIVYFFFDFVYVDEMILLCFSILILFSLVVSYVVNKLDASPKPTYQESKAGWLLTTLRNFIVYTFVTVGYIAIFSFMSSSMEDRKEEIFKEHPKAIAIAKVVDIEKRYGRIRGNYAVIEYQTKDKITIQENIDNDDQKIFKGDEFLIYYLIENPKIIQISKKIEK